MVYSRADAKWLAEELDKLQFKLLLEIRKLPYINLRLDERPCIKFCRKWFCF